MENIKTKKSILPSYAILPLLSCVAVNFTVYLGVNWLTEGRKHYDLTLPVDRAVPVVPEFAAIYLGCYIFWIVNYLLIAKQGKEHCMRFVTADMMSRIICGLIYLVLPTTNVRPDLAGDGLWVTVLQMIYQADQPTRLFPSIHCLVSWFCYIGIRGRSNVHRGYRIFSCLFAILVCVSTQMTKQHYIVDAFGGILLAEGTYWLAIHTQLYRYPERLFDAASQKLLYRQRRSWGKEGES